MAVILTPVNVVTPASVNTFAEKGCKRATAARITETRAMSLERAAHERKSGLGGHYTFTQGRPTVGIIA